MAGSLGFQDLGNLSDVIGCQEMDGEVRDQPVTGDNCRALHLLDQF